MGTAKRQLEKLIDTQGKNFLCPNCNTYSVKIVNFKWADCDEGCLITDEDTIRNLLNSNDYDIPDDDDFYDEDDF